MTDNTRRNIHITIVIICLFMATMVGMMLSAQLREPVPSEEELRERGVFIFDQPRIVRPFSLTSHHDKDFTNDDLEGPWTLIFFGFVNCPDICPITMAMLNQVLVNMDDSSIVDSTQVVMVTVDPARDTVETLAEFVPYFNQDFIGLTGEFMDIHTFASNLNAAFQRVPGDKDNYTVDHTGYIFLINPRGDYHGFIRPPFTVQQFSDNYQAVRKMYQHL